MRTLELFAGIGGFASAAGGRWETVAVDIDRQAAEVYSCNHPGRYLIAEIETLSVAAVRELAADMWWLSPPCQPYSRRGHQRDTADPRARSLLHLLDVLPAVRPRMLALENVVGFAHSTACQRLTGVLERAGYSIASRLLCPTEMGWPNRRPRFYLIASQHALPAWSPLPQFACSLASLLGSLEPQLDRANLFNDPQLKLDQRDAQRFEAALDRVDEHRPGAVTACFGSSYGKSIVRAGSYLNSAGGYRRFHPREVACLLGYSNSLVLPERFSYRQIWKLLGNSLSIPAVRYVLNHLR